MAATRRGLLTGKSGGVMTADEDVVLNLVGLVYDAALDERKWPSFHEALENAPVDCEGKVRLMDALTPHLVRALQVQRTLGSAAAEKESALGLLDQLRMGVILTNRCGEPLFYNRAAKLMRAQGISDSHNCLTLPTAKETELLYKLIAAATQGEAVSGDMRIALGSKHEYLHCLVTPVLPEFAAGWTLSLEPGYVAIFISKPGCLQLSPRRLSALYKFSPAEARLAARLAAFRSIEESAKDLGIAIATARAQLRSVFSKTGVKGQAALLMLLATGTLAHCCDP
ncbi:MAG: hypothetical protein EPO42_13355 [Gallionellaceae bacterium]|nr:MAG: hypothetical protein EPO42_13355 [Gallionellaceae bacterium]